MLIVEQIESARCLAWQGLRWLGIGCEGITDAGLRYLQGLTQLKLLILNNTQITDPGLKYLKI